MPANRCPMACSRQGACCARPCEANGILNINKPKDWTSHDVVARVRRLTNQRRAGHAGTLDPFATGVLLICLGQATRVSEYLMDAPKLYRACVRFGTATDTYDLTGSVTSESPVIPDLADIEALLPRFTGSILQSPPAYSAVKIDGERAYRRARKGETVALAPREVRVYSIEIRSWVPPDLEIDILCGKGTYIRSLAHDLGRAAGSAAHLVSLERRAVGRFAIDEAVPLEELERISAARRWREVLHPLDEALLQYPALIVSHDDAGRLLHGQTISPRPPEDNALARTYDPDGEFVALVRADALAGVWRPHKVFAQPTEETPACPCRPGSE